MRNRFEQQLTIGRLPIEETEIPTSKRSGALPGLCAALKEIFVLSQVRLCQNISYDELHDLANHHTLIRQIMGVESGFGHEKHQFGYQNIIDNVGLLSDDTVRALNKVIVEFGHDV